MKIKFISGAVIILGLLACTHAPEIKAAPKIAELEKRLEEMKPGLGELMGVIQQHHMKLYYSGKVLNWKLAQYQIDEIKEGLEDITKYHPIFKDIKLPIKELAPKIMNGPLAEVEEAIHKKNVNHFKKAFQNLTNACNSCHEAAEHGFIVIQTPYRNEFTNQKFSP